MVFNQDRAARLARVPNEIRPVEASPEAVIGGRCAAAHAEDPRPCDGAIDAVQIVDQTYVAVAACLLHGAVLLASLDRGRVYPLNGEDGVAITVFTRAQALRPFDFLVESGSSTDATPDETDIDGAGAEAGA
jgi:hypothetical protein